MGVGVGVGNVALRAWVRSLRGGVDAQPCIDEELRYHLEAVPWKDRDHNDANMDAERAIGRFCAFASWRFKLLPPDRPLSHVMLEWSRSHQDLDVLKRPGTLMQCPPGMGRRGAAATCCGSPTSRSGSRSCR